MDELLVALADDPALRRRQWIIGALVVGLLSAGAVGMVAAVRADRQACEGFQARLVGVWDPDRRAEVRAALEATALGYAPQTATQVEQRLDAYTNEWVAAREQACEATHQGEQSSALLDLRMACLDERLRHVEATVDVLAEADVAVLNKAIELLDGLPGLDRCADADALTAEVPPPEEPSVAERVAQLDASSIEAQTRQRAGKFDEALALASAVVAEADTVDYEPIRVRAWVRLGELQSDTGDYATAATTLAQARDTAVGVHMWPEAAHASAILIYVVGSQLEQHEAAHWWARDAKALTRAAGGDWTAHYFNSLGTLATAEAEFGEARAAHEQALAAWEAMPSPHPIEIAGSLNNLGNVAYAQGDYDGARAYHLRALEILEPTLGASHPTVAMSLSNLGIAAFMQGHYDEARGFHERALAIAEQTLGPDHPELAVYLGNLGLVAKKQQRYAEAKTYLERSLTIMQAALGPDHPQVGLALTNLGNLETRAGNYAVARGYHERALGIWEGALGPEHPAVATTLNNLGTVARLEGDAAQARGYYERSLAIKYTALGPDHPSVASAATGLGLALLDLGLPGPAVAKFEGALRIETAHDVDPLDVAETRFGLARALWDAPAADGRDRPRSRELAELARATYADAGPELATELEAVDAWLATAVIASAP